MKVRVRIASLLVVDKVRVRAMVRG